MKNKSKEAKFFCESCGSEVGRNDRVCTTCGRFFASVRCPKCGRTGTNDDFKEGCPTCGYAINPDKQKNNSSSNIQINESTIPSKNGSVNGIFNKSKFFGQNNKTSEKNGDGTLPVWVYILTVGILLALVIGLYSCL